MHEHIEISVSINPVCSEYVSEILINKIGCSGTVLSETYFEDEVVTEHTIDVVKGYLWLDKENPVKVEEIQSLLWQEKKNFEDMNSFTYDLGSWKAEFKHIKEEEWAHSWKKYWHPTKIGNKIVICPSWEEYEPASEDIIITLDPGSAFGTGTHPTTRLCVKALEKYVKGNEVVADIGTGSGILAISAMKLGAKSIVGVDNDPSVIEVATENTKINNISNFNYYTGSAVDVEGEYEIVTANILAHILIDIMQDLYKITKSGGKLILSGIIKEKEQDVINSAKENNFKYIETLDEDNWVAIIVEK